jgi:hypothetical protein
MYRNDIPAVGVQGHVPNPLRARGQLAFCSNRAPASFHAMGRTYCIAETVGAWLCTGVSVGVHC